MQVPPTFRVVYEDEHVLVVDKPAGMVTHPACRHPDGTLTDAVAAWMAARGLPNPWLLHRLDRDTSGLLLFAKSERAMHLCARQFNQHTAQKCYAALVWGSGLPDEGTITLPLRRDPENRRYVIVHAEGRASETQYSVCERFSATTLVALRPRTGRMHQLRVHMAALGHPIVGDPLYASPYPPLERLLLHATMLTICLPNGRYRTFLSPFPATFAALVAAHQTTDFTLPRAEYPSVQIS